MKLKLITLICIALLSVTAKAQNGRLSLGVELAMPVGNFADQSNLGVGGSLRYEHPLGDNFSFTGTAGVISFGGDEITSGVPNVLEYKYTTTSLMIPIQVGLKYYGTVMEGFYGHVEAGVHINTFTTKTKVTLNGNTSESSNTDSQTNFSAAPGIGYHLANFDIGVRYQMIFVKATSTSVNPVTQQTVTSESNTTYSYIGLRLAYVFGSK
jgi:hypothetical protein